jgi:hypothetical protein
MGGPASESTGAEDEDRVVREDSWMIGSGHQVGWRLEIGGWKQKIVIEKTKIIEAMAFIGSSAHQKSLRFEVVPQEGMRDLRCAPRG